MARDRHEEDLSELGRVKSGNGWRGPLGWPLAGVMIGGGLVSHRRSTLDASSVLEDAEEEGDQREEANAPVDRTSDDQDAPLAQVSASEPEALVDVPEVVLPRDSVPYVPVARHGMMRRVYPPNTFTKRPASDTSSVSNKQTPTHQRFGYRLVSAINRTGGMMLVCSKHNITLQELAMWCRERSFPPKEEWSWIMPLMRLTEGDMVLFSEAWARGRHAAVAVSAPVSEPGTKMEQGT